MTSILVIGASGMLGDAVAKEVCKLDAEVTLTSRKGANIGDFPSAKLIEFDVLSDELSVLDAFVSVGSFIVNCVGKLKSQIDETNVESVAEAEKLNVEFPKRLQKFAELKNAKVIQIATDCVFSGEDGHYVESSQHDATDVYGKTKSAGEISATNYMNIRCSTIGPERGRSTLLFEWVLHQPQHATISGFTNHNWNGVSTKAFAKVVSGLITRGLFKAGVQHLVPADEMNKFELVSAIAAQFGRRDIKIEPKPSGKRVDRTLATEHIDQNQALWRAAGYGQPPTIAQLLAEMAE